MYLKEIIDDIITDARIKQQEVDASSFRKRRGAGWMWIFLPQLIGFVLGLLAAVFLGADLTFAIVIGAFTAFIAGTAKSMKADQISFVPAVVRNVIIMVMIVLLGIFLELISRAMDK
ncbi:MAG: hypothetical protein IJM44_08565 [Ruminococcus sp.]|nr:hypothetical protein [Ruminococcus sp.]